MALSQLFDTRFYSGANERKMDDLEEVHEEGRNFGKMKERITVEFSVSGS